MIAYCALALGLYRFLEPHSRAVALVGYGGWITIFTVGGVVAVRHFVDDGTYDLGHGYTVFWDATWGVLMYALALAVYVSSRAIGARPRAARGRGSPTASP